MERVATGLQPRMDDTKGQLGAEWVLQPVRDGEWWIVVEREKCCAVDDGYQQENPPAGTQTAVLGGEGRRILRWVTGRSRNREGSD